MVSRQTVREIVSGARPRPRTSLTPTERRKLRRAKIVRRDLPRLSPDDVSLWSGIGLSRSQQLVSLAQFQSLGSVGSSLAAALWELGYSSVKELSNQSPPAMYTAFCHILGTRVDPCVEDVFRCAVAQARNSKLAPEHKNWWYWTPYRGTDRVAPQRTGARRAAAPTARR
jgi:hypothetical protein